MKFDLSYSLPCVAMGRPQASMLSGYAAADGTLPSLVADFAAGQLFLNGVWRDLGAQGSLGVDSPALLPNAAGGLTAHTAGDVPILHDPETGIRLGLAVEPPRANLVRWSADLTEAAWQFDGAAVAANATAAPLPSETAFALTAAAGTSAHHAMSAEISFADATRYTFSVFAKAGSASVLGLALPAAAFGATAFATFDLGNRSVGTAGAGVTARVERYANGWVRCAITATSMGAGLGAAALSVQDGLTFQASYAVGAPTNLLLWGPQVEATSHAASYVPTQAASVSKVSDTLTIPAATWLPTAEGTVLLDVVSLDDTRNIIAAELNSGGWSNRFGFQLLSGDNPRWFTTGPSGNSATLGAAQPVGAPVRFAVSYGAGTFSAAVNGAVFPDRASALPAGLSQIKIGSSPANSESLFGYVRQILIYPRKVSGAALLELAS